MVHRKDSSKMCNEQIDNRTNATTLAIEDLIAASSFHPVVLLVFHLFYFSHVAMTAKGEQCADLPEQT